MNDRPERVTVQDLADQNYDKIFPNGFAADQQEEERQQLQVIEGEGEELPDQALAQWHPQPLAVRPTFGINQLELEASKMMSTAGPLVPKWLRNRPGHCWGIIQLSKRWTRYNPGTNTWTGYDPLVIAQASYLVTSNEDPEGNVAFMSVFIRALVDSFAPTTHKLRYLWHGEGQERKCTCSGIFRGEREPHTYTTPPLRQIHPKKSPLWSSDPDRQLAYYASRSWARLYCPGVLLGVYDEDELEGDRLRQAEPGAGALPRLHERLAAARASGAERGGFRPGVVEAGIAEEGEQAEAKPEPEAKPAPKRAAGKAKDAPKPGRGSKDSSQRKKRTGGLRSAKPGRSQAKAKAEPGPGKAAPAAPEAQAAAPEPQEQEQPQEQPRAAPPPPPRNLAQYRAHVARWILELDREEAIEERWKMERQLRNQCGVTEDDRKVIRAELVDQRIAEVRNQDRER